MQVDDRHVTRPSTHSRISSTRWSSAVSSSTADVSRISTHDQRAMTTPPSRVPDALEREEERVSVEEAVAEAAPLRARRTRPLIERTGHISCNAGRMIGALRATGPAPRCIVAT